MIWGKNNSVIAPVIVSPASFVESGSVSGCTLTHGVTDYNCGPDGALMHVSTGAGQYTIESTFSGVFTRLQRPRITVRGYCNPFVGNQALYFGQGVFGSFTKYWGRSAGGPAAHYGYFAQQSPNWTTADFTTWTTSGSPKVSEEVTKIKQYVYQHSSQAYDFYIKDFCVGGYSRPTVVFTFDDSTIDFYSVVAPIFESYGMRCTVYAYPPGNGTTQVSASQFLDLVSRGFDVQGHGTQELTNYATEAEIRAIVRSNIDPLLALGINIEHFAYPGGKDTYTVTPPYDSTTIPTAIKNCGLKTARKLNGGWFDPQLYFWHPLAAYQLQAQSIQYLGSTFANGAANITTNLIQYGGTLIIYGHQVLASGATGNQINAGDLVTLLSGIKPYVDAGLIDVKTTSEWWNGLSHMSRDPII